MKNNDIQNPNFTTSTKYERHPFNKDEIQKQLSETLCRMFINNGHISSYDFSFINCATFGQIYNSELDYTYHGEKTNAQKEQAQNMIKFVQNYINEYYINDYRKESLEVCFESIGDGKCGLYNPDRFTQGKYCAILNQLFKK